MGLSDKLKNLTKKAEDAAAEHKDQIHHAVQKAEAAADQRTGGKYHDQIRKAGAKADAYLDDLKPDAAAAESSSPPTPPPATSSTPNE